MKKNRIYICYGYGSEYVLHDLYLELSKKHETYELEPFVEPVQDVLSRIGNISHSDVYFFTSAHLLFDNKYFIDVSGVSTYVVPSPLELISHLHPKMSFFFAHDLVQPILQEEIPYLSLFDYIIIPYELPFESHVKQESTILSQEGWIKFTNQNLHPKRSKYRLLFTLSDFKWHMNKGHDYTYQKFKPIFDAGAAIKLPIYPGDTKFEIYLKKKNVCVIPANTNSTQAILQSSCVITNGLSSTSAEASLLGIPTFLIRELDHNYYSSDQYRNLLTSFPQITLLDNASAFHSKFLRTQKKTLPRIRPFNLTSFINTYIDGIDG